MARRADPAKGERILCSAIEVFLEKGYRDATVAEIAGRAGLVASKMALSDSYFLVGDMESMKDAAVSVLEHMKSMEGAGA